MDERTNLVYNEVGGRNTFQPPPPSSDLPFSTFPIDTNGNRSLFEVALVGAVAAMSLITFILGLYRGIVASHIGGTYFMLGFLHLAFVLWESLLVVFTRNGQLEGDKSRFFYFMAGLTILHSLFTNIVLFSN